jgi:hypothetical protein
MQHLINKMNMVVKLKNNKKIYSREVDRPRGKMAPKETSQKSKKPMGTLLLV